MTTGRRRFGLPLLLVVSLTAAPVGAAPSSQGGESTEVAAARQHFKAGEKAFNAGEYTRALMEFEAGYLLVPRPGFLLNMAHTERRLGHTARARELYQRFLDAEPESKQRDEVLGLIAELDRTLYASGRGEPGAPTTSGTGVGAKPDIEPTSPAPPVDEEPAATRAPTAPAAAVTPLPQAPPPAEEPAELLSTRRRAETSDEPDDRQPVYKHWWFWAAMGVAAVGATTGIILATRPTGATFQNAGSLGRIGR